MTKLDLCAAIERAFQGEYPAVYSGEAVTMIDSMIIEEVLHGKAFMLRGNINVKMYIQQIGIDPFVQRDSRGNPIV